MNDQATTLSAMVQKFRAPTRETRLQWLFHSCLPQWNVQPAVDLTQRVLEEMGWETPRSWANQWTNPVASSPSARPSSARSTRRQDPGAGRPLALIAGTDSTRIELSRLGGTPAIIFVLDTKPVSLIKTYQQIKFLVRQTPAQECRLGVLFVTPTDRGSQRIGATCRRHLGIDVVDLGAVPETQWVSGVVPTAPDPILGPHPGEENPVATGRSTAWHQVVRRGLYGL